MTAGAARVTAHAKLNLALRVLARERGGYHALETLFARVALGDRVVVRTRPSGRAIDCRGADAGPPERNLALRAAAAYADATGWPAGFAIEIDKQIPVGGGLGGGSADAGAVLRALDALAPRPIGRAALLALAAALGSNVPYLTTTNALVLAWGRGERMLALGPLPERIVVLVFPDFAVRTADAYAWLDEMRGERDAAAAQRLDSARLRDWSGVAELSANDFEAPVAGHHPEIRLIIERLRGAGASIARLSGSGSTVFGVFDEAPDAASLAGIGPARHVLTRTIERVSAVEIID